MKHDEGHYRKYPLGYPVGGECHGGTVKSGKFRTPYPLDTSDYDGGKAELRPDMPIFAGGGAGGYKASTSKGGKS